MLRPVSYKQHATQFLVQVQPARNAAAAAYSCWHVPVHLQDAQRDWRSLLQGVQRGRVPQLVLTQQSQAATVLGKFEAAHFIHAYAATDSGASSSSSTKSSKSSKSSSDAAGMLFELPRFGLEFELRAGGVLASRNFRGYRLCQQQQLVGSAQGVSTSYQLPELQQYLVLRRDARLASDEVPGAGRAEVLVLVPAGHVCKDFSSGRVWVELSNSSGAHLQVRVRGEAACHALSCCSMQLPRLATTSMH